MAIGNIGLRNWSDKPTYIVGGGPSLKPYLQRLSKIHNLGYVIAVNNGFRYCKPDLIFSLDHQWLENSLPEIPKMQAPVIVAVEDDHPQKDCENLTYIERHRRVGGVMSEDPTKITNGHNSGYGALNLAYLKGAKTIYLLGFDFKIQNGQKHFHQGYTWTSPQDPERVFPFWAKLFLDTLPQFKNENVEVFNCSHDSLLTAFPYKPYDEVM